MALTMMQKRTDFASWMTTLLQAHDGGFIIDTTERRELEQAIDRESRLRITAAGDPNKTCEKYCIIRDTGQAQVIENSVDAGGNVDCFIGHRFDVQIFFTKDYDTSQSTFETIIYADRTATIAGLLDSIRATRERTTGGESYHVGIPGEDAFVSVQRGTWDFGALGGQPDLAHWLQFEVILIS